MAEDNGLALDYLGDLLYDALLGQSGAVRPANLLRAMPGDLRVSVGLIRKHLEGDSRFVEVDGRYDIAERDVLSQRPFGGVLEAMVLGYGRPMPAPLLARALERIRGGSPSTARRMLDEYLQSRKNMLILEGNVILDDWLLRMSGATEEEMLFYNGLQRDEDLREMWQTCQRRELRKRDPIATAASILDSLRRPIGVVQLAFLTWTHHPQIFEPVPFMAQLIADPGIIFVNGPRCIDTRMERAAQRELEKLAEKAKGTDEVMPAAALAEMLAQEPPENSGGFLEDDDVHNILAAVGNARVPIGVNELLADILELKPNARKYKIAAHAVQALLEEDKGLMRTSVGYYLPADAVPEWVRVVPDALRPAPPDPGEDVLLRIQGLHESLVDAVLDPAREDVRCGVPIPAADGQLATDTILYPLLYHHHSAGTMFVRALDWPVLEGQSEISVLTFRPPDADAFTVWLNRGLGLIFGLGTWYRQYVRPAGEIISLTPGDGPAEFVIEHTGKLDKAVALEAERVAALEEKRRRVATRPTTIFELLVELVGEHASGISFDALWSEMNVVRRTTRLQIASALTWFRCFEHTGGKAEGWRFVPELINAGGDEELAEYRLRPAHAGGT